MSDPIARLNAALEGRYRIEREIGEGGMATVYLVEDLRHERKGALKVLKPELAAVVGAERFLAEIKTTANLQHPHILPLHDSGEADGFLYFVMPYVEGESIRARLDREHQLPVDEAVAIAAKVSGALQAAHERGVIHRDIKPANILLSKGEPLVSDFGIALAVGTAGGGRLTETGLSLGTPYYMSPEQATGDQSVGPTTDVYALGCVLYEMLAGEPPYTGSTPQAILGKIITGEAPAASEQRHSVPANVDATIRRSLERVPADRFSGAADFARALGNPDFRHGRETAAGRVWRLSSLGWAVAALLAVVFAWQVARPRSSVPPPVTRALLPIDPARSIYLGVTTRGMDLSRDGRWLVYGGTAEGGDRMLFLRDLSEGEARPIPGTEQAYAPFFSPDAQWIGFFNAGQGELKKVALTGGTPVTLAVAPSPRGGSWSEDGTIVMAPRSRGELAVLSDEGGTPEPVSMLDVDLGETSHRQPHLLPGGEAMLFLAEDANERTEIWAQSLTTGERHRLVADALHPTFSPTGHLVYLQGGDLMAAPFDPTRLEVLGPGVTVAQAPDRPIQQFALSDAGVLIYTGSAGDGSELVWVDRETGEADPLGAPRRNYRYVHFSPGEDRLLVGGSGVGIFHLSTGVFEELGDGNWPVWTPDGTRVTFARSQPGTLYDIFERPSNSRGSAEALLVAEGTQVPSGWSPDGSTLAYTSADEEGEAIRLLSREGEPVGEPWIQTGATEEYATFSPDGSWIAYSSTETGRFEVYVRSLSGEIVRQITTEGGVGPRWSRDGRELFFRSGDGMYSVQISTGGSFEYGRPILLFEGSYQPERTGMAEYDVSGDGQAFVMIRSVERDTRLNLILNWHEELLERVPVP